MIALNQAYRIAATLAEHDRVRKHKVAFEQWARTPPRWIPYRTHPSLGKPGVAAIGRSYDAAVTLARINFRDLTVCELGARASLFAPYLTRWARMVRVSDLFGLSHRDLGGLEHWSGIWGAAAFNRDRLLAEQVDMRRTGHPSNHFDVTISFSAIEHIPGDGDTQAAVEMARITKPGGLIVIGTDMSDTFRQAGGYYYDEAALFSRIIEPTGCALWGDHDFNFETADRSLHKSGRFERTACIFILRKPE